MSNEEDAPSPLNSPILREMREMRRDMREIMERQARDIELQGRRNILLDEMVSKLHRSMHDIQSDIVLLESKILTAISEVRNTVDRVNNQEAEIVTLRDHIKVVR